MPLLLLQPDQLPRHEMELRAAPAGPGHRMLAARLSSGRAAVGTLEALRILPPALNGRALPDLQTRWPLSDIPYTYDARLREYDTFFGVSRVDPPGSGVFPQSLLVAYRSLLEEGLAAGTRMSWAEWSALCTTFHAMIGFVAGSEARPGPLPVPEPPLLRWHMDPHRRWRTGHHVFFVLTQSLIVVLGCLRAARREGDSDLARRMLRLAARLLGGSAAAFIFAAEFSASQYQARVRPSMEPPAVADGFSGLLSPDHHYLVRLMAKLRPVFRDLPVELVEDHKSFVRALEATYESHKYVCARFGGDRGASLRMSQASALPAVDVIHGLKVARTKLVRSPR
jgi:hypothetical protein